MHKEENLQISTAIDTRSEKEKSYDNYCKIILSNKDVLAFIMQSCMKEYQNCTLSEIKECIEPNMQDSEGNYEEQIQGIPTEDEKIFGAPIRYDIVYTARLPKQEKDEIGLIINLEAQNKDVLEYPLITRGIYYASRLIARQKNSPEGFVKSKFQNIKKVYSIWICMNHTTEKDNVFNVYSIKETGLFGDWKAEEKDYDLLNVIMLYPPKQEEENEITPQQKLLNFLSILFVSDADKDEKKDKLYSDYGIIMTRKIEQEVEKMCNLSQGIKERGIAEGMAKGRAEGIAIATKKEKETHLEYLLYYVKNLMKTQNMSFETAIDSLGLKPEDRQEISQRYKEGE